jgi:hypothetical protein
MSQVEVRASALIVLTETTERATLRFPDRSDWLRGVQPSTLTSYRTANAQPTLLSRCRLTFPVPYSYRKSEKHNPRASPTRLYLEFSRVGFSSDSTQAFVYSGYVGGAEFGAGFLTILARTAAGWKVVESTEVWIS